MNFYIKQHIFSFADRFDVFDKGGNVIYNVEGKIFSFGKKITVYNRNGQDVLYIQQKLFTFMPKYDIFCYGEYAASVKREFTFFRPKYSFIGLPWYIEGDFFCHDYSVMRHDGTTVATVCKHWFSWADTYEISVVDDADAMAVLAAVICIDCVNAQKNN